jgi:hypothetical protein
MSIPPTTGTMTSPDCYATSDTETVTTAATFHLGDPAAVHLRVGLVVFRCQSGPTCQLRWLAEAVDVPDLGDKHRAEYGADPRNGLNGLIAGVSTQPVSNQLGEQLDLAV